jgi:hypothetical protein
MITTKREEIRFKSGRLKALLFPYTLLVTESKYDYCYVKKIEADNPDANFEKFKTEMEIENFNGIQLKMLFDIFDIAYERYVLADWTEFSSLLKRAYNKNFGSLPDDLQFLNDENYIDLMKEKIEVKRKKVIENYRLSKEIYLSQIESPKIENSIIVEDFEEDTINDLFDDIRNSDYGKLKLHNILKEKTNFELDPLKYFLNDLELYLFVEKDEFESGISAEEIQKRVDEYNEKGLPIPFCKRTPIEDLTEKQIENRKKINISLEPSIDTEALMYPFEFYSLYEFKRIILNEIKKHDKVEENNTVTSTNPKLKTNLSVPELALLFKLLKDLKPNIFDIKSEAELHRFISTNFETKRTGDKDISTQKLRSQFNQPDIKAAEFWETNLRLLQADVKKFK